MNQDFSYLRPPKEVYQVKHDPHYIKHGEGLSHVRKMFYNQQYDDYEEEKIQELEALIEQNQVVLPVDWTRALTCKYVYSGNFNGPKSLERLKKHLEWRADPLFQVISPKAEQLLRDGIIYQFGRDQQFRPVVYIRLYMIAQIKPEIQDLLCATTNLLNTVAKNMYVPGYVENWIIIIDLNGSGLFDTPFSTLTKINEIMSINYTSTLHRMFVLNPSFLFYASWKVIEKMIHPETAQKIQILKKSDFNLIQNLVDPEQIELKYGGSHPNLTSYWPINNTLRNNMIFSQNMHEQTPKNLQKQLSFKESEFYSLDNNSKFFFQQSQKLQDFSQDFGQKKNDLSVDHSDNIQNAFNTTGLSEQNQACCTCQIQ